MKILFLNLYSGVNRRGAESFIHALANRFACHHDVVSIQAGQKLPEQKYRVIQINFDVYQPQELQPTSFFGTLKKYAFLDQGNRSVFNFTKQAIKVLKKEKPDVIFSTNGFWQLLLVKLFLSKKMKIIVIGHSGPGWDEKWNLWLKPDLFVATTKPTFDWAKNHSLGTKIELIPYGTSKEMFMKAKQIKLNLPRPIILCPSALVSYKRVDLALKAVAKLGHASLLVLGEGPLKREIQNLGEKLLKGRFFMTSVSHDQMAGYYNSIDLVTLPSMGQENSPMVFLEALVSGKMVVTTDNPRSRWMLEDAGVYCNPVDRDAYTDSLKYALELPQARKENNIRLAQEKFSMDQVVSLYEKLIN